MKVLVSKPDGQKPEDTIVGQGNLPLNALVQLLHDIHYDGFLTTEYEDDAADLVSNSTKCVKTIKSTFARAV